MVDGDNVGDGRLGDFAPFMVATFGEAFAVAFVSLFDLFKLVDGVVDDRNNRPDGSTTARGTDVTDDADADGVVDADDDLAATFAAAVAVVVVVVGVAVDASVVGALHVNLCLGQAFR